MTREYNIGREIRYVRNELKKIRDIADDLNKETRTALVDAGLEVKNAVEELRKEIKLCRQSFVLVRLSEMTKRERKAFLKMAEQIQKEDDFMEAFDGVDSLIDLKVIRNTL